MQIRLSSLRWILLLGCVVLVLAACGGDDDDDNTPTEAAVAATPTATAEETTPTNEPTEEPATTSTVEPTEEPTSEPTARTRQPRPTSTPIIINTPTPAAVQDPSGLIIPTDLLTILPLPEEIPGGANLSITTDEHGDVSQIAAQSPNPAEFEQLLIDAGFQNAARRTMELPDDAPFDDNSGILALNSVAIQLGASEGAVAELSYHRDIVMLPDPQFALSLVEIPPIGDSWSAATSTVDVEGTTLNIAVVWSQAGPMSLRTTVLSSAAYDPLPDAIASVQTTLELLGYSGGSQVADAPAEGDVIASTDFSDWVTGDLESGMISFVDGTYRLTVNDGGGSYVSAYTDQSVFSDFSVTVDLRMTTGSTDATGCVLARLDPEALNYNYALCISGGGSVAALYEQFDAEGAYSSESLLESIQSLEGSAQEWNQLKIIIRGSDLWFYVNEQLIGSATHEGPTEGHTGVIVNNFGDTPAEFEFTNMVIRGLQ